MGYVNFLGISCQLGKGKGHTVSGIIAVIHSPEGHSNHAVFAVRVVPHHLCDHIVELIRSRGNLQSQIVQPVFGISRCGAFGNYAVQVSFCISADIDNAVAQVCLHILSLSFPVDEFR